MRYGEIATGAPRPEKFLPGAFKIPPDGVILNVQHDRNKPIARTPDTLILTDTAESLELRADVPGTQEGTDYPDFGKESHPYRSIRRISGSPGALRGGRQGNHRGGIVRRGRSGPLGIFRKRG